MSEINDIDHLPTKHEQISARTEHEQPAPEGEEWRIHRLPGERRDAVVADSRSDKLICEAAPEDAATIVRNHRLAALVPGLVEAMDEAIGLLEEHVDNALDATIILREAMSAVAKERKR